MVAPYSIRIHPYSRVPLAGDRGYLIRVAGTNEYLFSRYPAGAPDRPVLYGAAPRVLGLEVSAEGACVIQSINSDGTMLIRPLSDAETRELLSIKGGAGL